MSSATWLGTASSLGKENPEATFTFRNVPQIQMARKCNFSTLEMVIVAERGIKAKAINETFVLVVAHCILNRSTRWWQNGQPLERNQGPVSQILQFLSGNKIGVVQLPCPEFTFLGNPRSPATKDDYESLSGFREHCKRLANDSAIHIKRLTEMGRNPKIVVLAVAGVERSPSCGVECTPRKTNGKVKYVEERGIFFELLEKEMEDLNFTVPILGLNTHQPENLCCRLTELLGKTPKR
jgi:predicted secreted protein